MICVIACWSLLVQDPDLAAVRAAIVAAKAETSKPSLIKVCLACLLAVCVSGSGVYSVCFISFYLHYP